ncbi:MULTISPECIES: glutathione S-transferase family protein [unclassified Caulobacter]|uniref:glutathione S-transferase family protein n=1 Tax=unclassified Caulobacter TaxID=2648921 RepID=UPI000D3CD79C|nr:MULTISPECIES: glutathione S-transferase [unclassified Caulobacter]PTS90354.1 glutathione S-transferase [Caulobacter sp. HMWF009]PTT08069.1 glutathione S-transferase [Caulobacter sp. HMWF025]
MLKVWGRRSSFNVQKVLWLVGELDLPHEHIPASGDFGGLDDPGFLAMNPHGRIPVIDDGGTIVWESHAILRYLAAQHGGLAWWPKTPADRVATDGWMDWAQSTLQHDFLTGVFWGWYRTPETQRDLTAVRTALAACARHFTLLDEVLARRPFLGGAAPGLADIPLGTHLYRYFALEIDRAPTPHVEAWYTRLRERPAYRQHVMIPFAEMKGRLAY